MSDHPKITTWLIKFLPVGAVVSLVAFVLGGVLAVQTINANKARTDDRLRYSMQLNQFLRTQCERDHLRDAVIIGALRDAQNRARASITNPAQRAKAVGQLENSVVALQYIGRNCVKTIPPADGGKK